MTLSQGIGTLKATTKERQCVARKRKQVLDSKISWSASEVLPISGSVEYGELFNMETLVVMADRTRLGEIFFLFDPLTDHSVMSHCIYRARSFRELPDARIALVSTPMTSLLTIYANGDVICVRPREAQSDIRVDTSSEVSGTGVSMSTPHPPAIAKAPACT
jgi:hypothetical protein